MTLGSNAARHVPLRVNKGLCRSCRVEAIAAEQPYRIGRVVAIETWRLWRNGRAAAIVTERLRCGGHGVVTVAE